MQNRSNIKENFIAATASPTIPLMEPPTLVNSEKYFLYYT